MRSARFAATTLAAAPAPGVVRPHRGRVALLREHLRQAGAQRRQRPLVRRHPGLRVKLGRRTRCARWRDRQGGERRRGGQRVEGLARRREGYSRDGGLGGEVDRGLADRGLPFQDGLHPADAPGAAHAVDVQKDDLLAGRPS